MCGIYFARISITRDPKNKLVPPIRPYFTIKSLSGFVKRLEAKCTTIMRKRFTKKTIHLGGKNDTKFKIMSFRKSSYEFRRISFKREKNIWNNELRMVKRKTRITKRLENQLHFFCQQETAATERSSFTQSTADKNVKRHT